MKMLSTDSLTRLTQLLHMSGGKDLYIVFLWCLHILVLGLGNNGAEERKSIIFRSMSNQNMIMHAYALVDHELFTKE